MSDGTEDPVAPPAQKRPAGGVLLLLLLIPYLFLKFQALGYARETKRLEQELDKLRPALSAMVLSEQLKKTEQVCAEISAQVRRLDLRNGRLLDQLSRLPASITLDEVENRARLKVPLGRLFSTESQSEAPLQVDLWMQGRLLPGIRDPEGVLVRWAQSLQTEGTQVQIRRLTPSPGDQSVWLFELRLVGV